MSVDPFWRTFPVLIAGVFGPLGAQEDFVRGDANQDGTVDLSDAVCTLNHLFVGDPGPCKEPECLDALDADDDGVLNVTDPINVLGYLFLGAPPLPAPFEGCGPDPTADTLGCRISPACGGGGITFRTAADVRLFSIWGEGYDTVFDQQSVLSIIGFREGSFTMFLERDTEELDWIETLWFGPDLTPAEPVGPGVFVFNPMDFHPYEYRQAFETGSGLWTFVLRYRPEDETREETVGCAFFDGCEVSFSIPKSLHASLGGRRVHYSCFCPEVWRSPFLGDLALTLEDGTLLRLEIEESYLGRGIAGETGNRRLAAASVEFRGRSFRTTDFERLIYAGRHHNASQEFRVLFDEPVDGIHGIDVVECPPPNPFPTFCGMTLEESRAHYLDGSLERTQELRITEIANEKE